MLPWVFRRPWVYTLKRKRRVAAKQAAVVPPAPNGGLYLRALWTWGREFDRDSDTLARRILRARGHWERGWGWRHMATEITAKTLVKPASEDRDYGFDCSDSPEILGGATISSASISGGSGLTIGSPRVNEAFDGITAGKVVVVRISGGTAGTTYKLSCHATLSTSRVLVIPARLVVVVDTPTS